MGIVAHLAVKVNRVTLKLLSLIMNLVERSPRVRVCEGL